MPTKLQAIDKPNKMPLVKSLKLLVSPFLKKIDAKNLAHCLKQLVKYQLLVF